MHLLQLGKNLARMTQQGFAGRCRPQATMVPGKKRNAQGGLKLRQSMTGRRGRQMDARGSTGQTATFGNRSDEPQIGKIVVHGFVQNECLVGILPIAKP